MSIGMSLLMGENVELICIVGALATFKKTIENEEPTKQAHKCIDELGGEISG